MTDIETYEKLAKAISNCQLFHRTIKKNVDSDLKELNEFYKTYKSNPDMMKMPTSVNLMSFYNPENNQPVSFGVSEATFQEKVDAVYFNQNRQYCWLLAEAYEAFEDFLEDIYSIIGKFDNNLWTKKDRSLLQGNAFEEFKNVARNKRGLPTSIVNQLRRILPDLEKIDTTSINKVNYKLAIVLISKLRHIIVHNKGIVSSREGFDKRVLCEAGLYNNGNTKKEFNEFIDHYFGEQELNNYISLLEVRIHKDMPIKVETTRFDNLTNYMVAYAYLTVKYFQNKIGNITIG